MSVINYSLENIERAFSKLGPYDFKTIHIAGTNGKGSVCSFLELLYLICLPEIRVGKYTSPHIWSITERFAVNGKDIDQAEFDSLWTKYDGLTEFEEKTLLAFEYFKKQEVDVAILETGLGGRLDATNVIPTENRIATAITNIGMDHMDYLGDSLEKIRKEKEGIKKEGVPHFEGLESEANPNSSEGSNFLLALDIFASINDLTVAEEQKQEVLKRFPQRHRARFDCRDGVLIDTAHNPAAMQELNSYIKTLPRFDRKIFVLAFLDKDYQACIEALFEGLLDPDQDLVILTEIDSARATPAFLLDEIIDANKMLITDPQEAIATAQELSKENDLVVITGSFCLIELFKQA